MAKGTGIQWCDDTVNPTMGCNGCPLWNETTKKCYAGKETTRRRNNPGFPAKFEDVTLYPGRMAVAAKASDLRDLGRRDKPWLDGLPRTIFIGDMSDNFSKEVPFEYLEAEVINNVASQLGQRHQWLWLTKRPHRMAKFSQWLKGLGVDWPQNLWAGTSIMDQKMTAGIKHLLKVGDEYTLRFLSVEPQWERLDLREWLDKLDWVIQGGEWDPKPVPFDIAWAEEQAEQCREAKVAYFLKQLGSHVVQDGQRIRLKNGHGGDMSEWPEHLRIRQMPVFVTTRPDGIRQWQLV